MPSSTEIQQASNVNNDSDMRRKVTELMGGNIPMDPWELPLEYIDNLKVCTKDLGIAIQRKTRNPDIVIREDLVQRAKEYLWYLSELGEITSELNKRWVVQGTLGMIDRGAWPQEFKNVATSLHKKFEAQNWGSVQASSADTQAYRRAPDNHPIFGLRGVCHHILVKKWPINYKIDPDFPIKVSSVHGANGLTVGDCWPMLRCALRDGAHGATVAGITGNDQTGAYSIIVSGAYKDLDRDIGDVIYYSAADARDSRNPTPDREKSTTKYLIRSIATQRPVRVIRSEKAEWAGAPRSGYRYDGLYLVEKEREKQNKDGGKYLQFKLVRRGGQDRIAQDRPTPEEYRAFCDCKRGF